ncbi:lithostathine-1-like isoform X1 [Mytilus galloprovincialis]|uniref:lithostathine-1-like isoform X1 n=2 Tax=Mytilus galloprovincialis TaxID=29158 RepID=UPI003F7C282F
MVCTDRDSCSSACYETGLNLCHLHSACCPEVEVTDGAQTMRKKPVAASCTCPIGYTKLDNQQISRNCYLFGGLDHCLPWQSAEDICMSTRGAHLWVPDSKDEAEALRDKFGIGDDDADVWTGAKDLKNNGTYLFTQTNTQLDLDNLPFGHEGGSNRGRCVELEIDDEQFYEDGYWYDIYGWFWDADECDEDELYVCEFPVVRLDTFCRKDTYTINSNVKNYNQSIDY